MNPDLQSAVDTLMNYPDEFDDDFKRPTTEAVQALERVMASLPGPFHCSASGDGGIRLHCTPRNPTRDVRVIGMADGRDYVYFHDHVTNLGGAQWGADCALIAFFQHWEQAGAVTR